MKKIIILAAIAMALGSLGQAFAYDTSTNQPPVYTNTPPVIDTNAPPVGTNQPPAFTNLPPVVCTNLPPIIDTNNPPIFTNRPPMFDTNTPPVWTNTAPPPPPTDWTNNLPPVNCTNLPPQKVFAPGQNPLPQLPTDVKAAVNQFQSDRDALMKKLKDANATQRAAILGQLETDRNNFLEVVQHLREDAQNQATHMKNMFNNNQLSGLANEGASSGGNNSHAGPPR